MSDPTLEIIIPARDPRCDLATTVESLVAQTQRSFTVLLSGNGHAAKPTQLDVAQKKLTTAGIGVRRATPSPMPLSSVEHWNWAHAQSTGEWVKLLLPGEQLTPNYAERITTCAREHPKARLIRCDAEVRTEWGIQMRTAPMKLRSITSAEFLSYFPAHIAWISNAADFAWNRAAWIELGGFSSQMKICAGLNLIVLMALHHGLENIPETLVKTDLTQNTLSNGERPGRVNFPLELWFVLRQAENYCLAAGLPWTEKRLFLRALLASALQR